MLFRFGPLANALLALFRGKVTPVEQVHAGGSAPVYNLQRPTEIAHVKRGAKNGMAVDAFLRGLAEQLKIEMGTDLIEKDIVVDGRVRVILQVIDQAGLHLR